MTGIQTRTPLRTVGERARAASRTTPGRYRLWSLASAGALVVAAVAATASASQMRSSTQRAEAGSGPSLVATQQLVSSLAEADAAASAAFLSGKDEDPEQRRLYEEALARAGQQVEEIAALAGRDPGVRTLVGRISVQLTRYAGLVEAARASNRNANADANDYLVSAVRLAEQLVEGDVATLADRARETFGRDEDGRAQGLGLAALALVVAVGVLGGGQFKMVKVSRRIVNLPLALATVLALAGLVWLVVTAAASGRSMVEARRDGYDSIVLTARLASAGFGAKAAETLAVIAGDDSRQKDAQRRDADANAAEVASAAVTPAVADLVRRGAGAGVPGGIVGTAAQAADSPRERAAVAEVGVRWQRYQASVTALRAAPTPAAARAIAVGQASSDFNGFNFSVQSVLGQNRAQFLDGLASAADRTRRAPAAVPVLMVASLAAMFWGFQIRINEYR